MNPISKAIIVLLAATSASFAGWIVSVNPEHLLYPGMASIAYSADKTEGHATFAGTLKHLPDQGQVQRLKWVTLLPFIHDADFQKELFSALERNAPKALQEALQSSGNMHNPKMNQLYRPFMEAVLVTSAVKKISRELAAHNLRVTGAGGEKFMLIKDQGQPRFMCSLVLEIERIAEPGPAPTSR